MIRYSLKICLLVCFYFLILPNEIAAQDLDSAWEDTLGSIDSLMASSNFEGALALINTALEESGINHWFALEKRKGQILFRLGNTQAAIQSLENSITYLDVEELFQSSSSSVYALLGYIFRYYKYDKRKALLNYKRELECIITSPDSFDLRSKFYNAYNLATTYRLIEDYHTGLNYAHSALTLAKKESNDQYLELSHSALANLYNALDDHEKSITYYRLNIESIKKNKGKYHITLANAFNNLATTYLDISNYQKANEAINESFIVEKQNPASSQYLADSWLIYGNIKVAESKFQKATHAFAKALGLTEENYSKAVVHMQIGKAYEKALKLEMALKSYNEAHNLIKLTHVENASEQVIYEPFTARLVSLIAGTQLKLFKNSGDLPSLQSANLMFSTLDKNLRSIRKQYFTQEAKLLFQNYSHKHYELAFEALYLLQETEFKHEKDSIIKQAWSFFENSKAQDLLNTLGKVKFHTTIGLSDSLVRSDKNLNAKYRQLSAAISSCERDNSCMDSILSNYRKDQAEIAIALDNLKKRIIDEYPAYKQHHDLVDIVTLQDYKRINQENPSVSFFYGQSHIYFLLISDTNDMFGRIRLTPELSTRIETFNDLIDQKKSSSSLLESFNRFTESSHFLYEKLVAPWYSNSIGKLAIFPDGPLNEIPFEALLTNEPSETGIVNYKDLPYMLRFCGISYSFSASQLTQQTKVHDQPWALNVLAIGEAINDLPQLKGTAAELSNVKKQAHKATIFSGIEAKKQKILSTKSKDNTILHLALHAKSDSLNPLYSTIYFTATEREKGELKLFELYELELNKQLVVLSGCETGKGIWQKGEGILSLSKGFAHAGNPNLVMSLWRIPDQSTPKIVKAFYNYLSQATEVSESLRKSKLDFLNQADELVAHPKKLGRNGSLGRSKSSFRKKLGDFLCGYGYGFQ